MGQAKRRGTFEQRRDAAITAQKERFDAEMARRETRKWQEKEAWKLMVWWQEEMTIERYNRFMRRKSNSQLAAAQILGMAYGMGRGGLGAIYR